MSGGSKSTRLRSEGARSRLRPPAEIDILQGTAIRERTTVCLSTCLYGRSGKRSVSPFALFGSHPVQAPDQLRTGAM